MNKLNETQAYRIRDWEKHFENNRTRELKRMDWLPVPNKHDGSGFTALLDHPNGVAHYGAWHLILQVASKCDPRGTLLREGVNGIKVALSCGEIGRMSHSPAGLIKEAMGRLVSIGWIEVFEMSQEGATNPALSCASRARATPNGTERNGTEGKRMERKGTTEYPSTLSIASTDRVPNEGSLVRLKGSLEKGKREDWNSKCTREKMLSILGANEIASRHDWLRRLERSESRIEEIMDAMHADLLIGHIIKNRGAYAETLWKKAS